MAACLFLDPQDELPYSPTQKMELLITPPVNIKEVILGLHEPMEELYKLRVERGQPLPEAFGKVCRLCAAILMAEERANG